MADLDEQVDEDVRKRELSALHLAELTLSNLSKLHPAHVNELLSLVAWMHTEAAGKYTPRFSTPAALAALEFRGKVQHEHVIPRRLLRTTMLEHPGRSRELLSLAVACLVTPEEHRLLGSEFGWHRYVNAGLTVVETDTTRPVDIASLAQTLDAKWERAISGDMQSYSEESRCSRLQF